MKTLSRSSIERHAHELRRQEFSRLFNAGHKALSNLLARRHHDSPGQQRRGVDSIRATAKVSAA